MTEEVETTETNQVELVHWLEQLRVDLTRSINTVPQKGARAVPLPYFGGRVATANPGVLVGVMVQNERADQELNVFCYDGADSNGEMVFRVKLAAGEATRVCWFPPGINLSYGLYVQVNGLTAGHIYLAGPQ